MNKEVIKKLVNTFEKASHITEEGTEYWFARDIQIFLEYAKWGNFQLVIDKAKIACENAGGIVVDHFADVGKPIRGGKGAVQIVDDYKLTRYACYLIAQNGDSKKEAIAFAQSYFALQTRKQELLEERIEMLERLEARRKLTHSEKELSEALYEHGVDDKGFARIRSKGDQSLFGGFSTKQMKEKLKVPESRPLADFLPTVTIKAKDFAAEITRFNVFREGLDGKNQITEEHMNNNTNVREALLKSNIYPENLPPAIDIKKIERQLKKEDKEAFNKSVNVDKIKQKN